MLAGFNDTREEASAVLNKVLNGESVKQKPRGKPATRLFIHLRTGLLAR
jgi:hypothetical protein